MLKFSTRPFFHQRKAQCTLSPVTMRVWRYFVPSFAMMITPHVLQYTCSFLTLWINKGVTYTFTSNWIFISEWNCLTCPHLKKMICGWDCKPCLCLKKVSGTPSSFSSCWLTLSRQLYLFPLNNASGFYVSAPAKYEQKNLLTCPTTLYCLVFTLSSAN